MKLTYADAYGIQLKHLAQWKIRLNSECYTALAAEVMRRNKIDVEKNMNDPYTVFRGDSLSSFVENWKPDKVISPVDNDRAIARAESGHSE